MNISFGDGACDAYVDLARSIRSGYTVALLAPGQSVPAGSDVDLEIDVRFVSADHDGVTFRPFLDVEGDQVGPEARRSWEDIEAIHVY